MYFSRIFYLFVIVAIFSPIGWSCDWALFFNFFFSLIPALCMFVCIKHITFMCPNLLLGVFSMFVYMFYMHLLKESAASLRQDRTAQATSWTRGTEWTTGPVEIPSGGPFGPEALAQ